jgi:hypothetical protein
VVPDAVCALALACRARAEAREKAAAHLAAGNVAAAVECYQRCVDITPAMAKHVIEVCVCVRVRAQTFRPGPSIASPCLPPPPFLTLHGARAQMLKAANVAFLVAPYEADAQMAFLARTGQVQVVVTEDSDLLAYGCPRCVLRCAVLCAVRAALTCAQSAGLSPPLPCSALCCCAAVLLCCCAAVQGAVQAGPQRRGRGGVPDRPAPLPQPAARRLDERPVPAALRHGRLRLPGAAARHRHQKGARRAEEVPLLHQGEGNGGLAWL